MLACLMCSQPSLADPLHKFGPDGGYRHESSGWIFPRHVAGLERVDAPYLIDGNDDVGADYATVVHGARRTALVHVYHADSGASGSKLATAATQEAFAVGGVSELAGVKISGRSQIEAEGTQSVLYFFKTPAWVVTVRTTAPTADLQAAVALDEFVHALRWDTLGSDAGNLHGPGP
jgi:hypothetical protein